MNEVQRLLIENINGDTKIQDEDYFNKTFETQERVDRYNEIYEPIKKRREQRNSEISKKDIKKDNIFENSNKFHDYCVEKKDYYITHKSFTEYISVDDIMSLVKKTDLEGIYEICRVFRQIYYMGNAKEFFVADIDNLIKFRDNVMNEIEITNGITHQQALKYLLNEINTVLSKLGYENSEG